MHAVEIMVAISRAKKLKTILIPLVTEDISGSGLTIVRTTIQPNGKPLFCYVDRLEYIRYLETKYQLIRKRASLRNVLRDRIRKS